MSAKELIKEVATLPPAERALFDNLLRAMNTNGSVKISVENGNWPDFSNRLRQIYGNKIASDAQAAIDEERGDR